MKIKISHPDLEIDRDDFSIKHRSHRLNLLQCHDTRLFVANGNKITSICRLEWNIIDEVSLKSSRLDNLDRLEYLTDYDHFPPSINQIRLFDNNADQQDNETRALLFVALDCGTVFHLNISDNSSLAESLFEYDSVHDSAWSLAYSTTLSLLAVGSNEHAITIFKQGTRTPLRKIQNAHLNNIPALDFDNSRGYLLSGSIDGEFHIYDCHKSFELIGSISIRQWIWSIVNVSGSHDNQVHDNSFALVATSDEIFLIRNGGDIVDKVSLAEHLHFRYRRISIMQQLPGSNYCIAIEQISGLNVLFYVDEIEGKLRVETVSNGQEYFIGAGLQTVSKGIHRFIHLHVDSIIEEKIELLSQRTQSALNYLDFDQI